MFGYLTQFYQNAYQALFNLWVTSSTNALMGSDTQASLTESGLTFTSSTLMQQGAESYPTPLCSDVALLDSANRVGEVSSAGFGFGLTDLPVLDTLTTVALTAAHPVLGAGWVLARQMSPAGALPSENVHPDIEDISQQVHLKTYSFDAEGHSPDWHTKDMTDVYRQRHLQQSSSDCASYAELPYSAPGWATVFGISNYNQPQGLAFTEDGGAILATGIFQQSNNNDSNQILLTRFDPTGNLLWAKTWQSYGASFPRALTLLDDGGFLILGWTHTDNNARDVLLLNVDANGRARWAKTIGSEANETGCDLVWDDQALTIVGLSVINVAQSLFLFNLDLEQDTVVAHRVYPAVNHFGCGCSIGLTAEHNRMVVGQIDPLGQGSTDILLMSLSPSALLQWSKVIGTPDDEAVYHPRLTPEGHIAMVGQSLQSDVLRGLTLTVTSEGQLEQVLLIDQQGAGYGFNDHGFAADGRWFLIGADRSTGAWDATLLVMTPNGNITDRLSWGASRKTILISFWCQLTACYWLGVR
jgi:hypothetical protein